MRAAVLFLTLMGGLAWETTASAQFGQGVPGSPFGSGGLYSSGGPSFGLPGAPPSYNGPPSGYGSASQFRGFTYSPYNYSSPSYGVLTPTFGGSSSGLGIGTSPIPRFTVPVYGERSPSPVYGVNSYRGHSRSSGDAFVYGDVFRADRFLPPAAGENFYSTGFGPPTWRKSRYVRPW